MRTRLTFSYDYGQVYLYDSARAWPDANVYVDALADAEGRGRSVGEADGLVDLLMVGRTTSRGAVAARSA